MVTQLVGRRRRDDPLEPLTPREREVLELMAEGRSNQAIAERLVVTERAVEKHVTSIFGKLSLPAAPRITVACWPCSPTCARKVREMQQTQLKTTELGATGMEITRVGLGAWAIGGAATTGAGAAQDDEDSIAAIHQALELGVNWIDTAAQYGFGHSEEVVGRALAGLDERPYVFTKAGQPEGPGRTTVHEPARDSIRRELEGSLDAARGRRDRPLPDPLADPGRGDRGGLVDLRRAEGRGPRPPHRRLQLRRRAAAPRSGRSRRSRPSSRSTR